MAETIWNVLATPETIWLLITAILCVIEGCTLNLVTLWFAFGGLAGLICVAFGGPVWLQIVIFIIVSFATMIAFRPFAKRHLKQDKERTNADRILGKTGLVTVDIDENCNGQISIEGIAWTAKSEEKFVMGDKVTVIGIEGSKAVVGSLKTKTNEDAEEGNEYKTEDIPKEDFEDNGIKPEAEEKDIIDFTGGILPEAEEDILSNDD